MKHGMKIVNGKRVYLIEFTDEYLSVVHEGLMHVPYGRAAPVVNYINSQLKPEVDDPKNQAANDLGYHRASPEAAS